MLKAIYTKSHAEGGLKWDQVYYGESKMNKSSQSPCVRSRIATSFVAAFVIATVWASWQTVSKAAEESASLDVRFAAAQLRLAQAELEYTLDVNSNSPGLYPDNFIAELRVRIDIARAALDETSKPGGGDVAQIYIHQAEGELKIAELHLAEGRKLHEANPRIVNDLYLKRLELRVEAAKLAIDKVRSPEFQKSETEQIRWQLAQLQRDMLRLRVRIEKEL
jgi:hypothetical protein